MAIQKIEEVHVYYSDAYGSAAENIQAVALMEKSGIEFKKMYYNKEANIEALFSALNSWWVREDGTGLPELNTFPFITYVEVHDDIPARLSPVKYLKGLDLIKTFPDFYNSVMANK